MVKRLPLLLFISFVFTQKEYDYNDLIIRDDSLMYKKFSDELLTGRIYRYYGEASQKKDKVYIGRLRIGKRVGKWNGWYENGKKKYEKNYKDGKLEG